MAVWSLGNGFEVTQAVPGAELYARVEAVGAVLDQVPDDHCAPWTELAWRQANQARGLLRQISHLGRRVLKHYEGSPVVGRFDIPGHDLGICLHMSPRAAEKEFDLAYQLMQRLPALGAAMLAGDLDEARATAFAEGTAELPDDLAVEVVSALLDTCYAMAVPRLKAAIVKHALSLDPEYGKRVYEAAVRRCNVTGRSNPQGTAQVSLSHLPPEWAARAVGRTDAIAKAAKADGDPRPIGLLRALIAVCRMDGTFDGLDEAGVHAYLKAARPDPGDPDVDLPQPAPKAPRARSRRGPRPGDQGGGEGQSGPDGPDAPDMPGPPGGRGGPGRGGPATSWDPEPTHAPSAESCAGAGSPPDEQADPASGDAGRPDPGKAEPAAARAASADPSVQDVPPAFSRHTGVELQVGLATLLGLDRHPAELAGWAPVGPAHAIALAEELAAGEWRWAVTDSRGYPVRTGVVRARPHGYAGRDSRCEAVVDLRIPRPLLRALLAPAGVSAEGAAGAAGAVEAALLAAWRPVLAEIAACLATPPPPEPDPRRRFPDARLRRRVQQAIPHCVGPYCAVPSRRCEIDHQRDRSKGGGTVFLNLGPLCRCTHRVKSLGGLTITRTGRWRFTTTTRFGTTCTVTSPPLLEPLPDPRPSTAAWPHGRPTPVPAGDDSWRHDEPWDTWVPEPRRSRDWVAREAAKLRAAGAARRRHRGSCPPPAGAEAGPGR